MPKLDDAVRYVRHRGRSEAELRRACAILALREDGDTAGLRRRLDHHLAGLDPNRPALCLHPGPVPSVGGRPGPRVPPPDPDEYAPVFAAEIGLVPDAADFGRRLTEQLEVTRSMVITFGEAHADLSYAPGKWSVREIIGHLADCERVLSYRLLRILRGDRTPVPGFDHEAYVPAGRFGSRSSSSVMAEFAAVRAATTALVNAATPADFEGTLPVGSGRISGRALAYLIAGHELHHQNVLRDRYLPLLPAER
jgi:hypothetical protein